MTDSVAIDAKRILLRYGAPIAILDKVSESHRIEFAREIAKTVLPDREHRLRELLAHHGYADAVPVAKKGRGKKARVPVNADSSAQEEAPKPANVATPTKVSGKSKDGAKSRASTKASAAKASAAKAKVAAKTKVAGKAKGSAQGTPRAKAKPGAKAKPKSGAARSGKPTTARKKR